MASNCANGGNAAAVDSTACGAIVCSVVMPAGVTPSTSHFLSSPLPTSTVSKRWLVEIGSIATLHTMEPHVDAPQPGTPLPAFAQMLSRLRSGDRA